MMDQLSVLKDEVFSIFPLWTNLSSPNKFLELVSIYFYKQEGLMYLRKATDSRSDSLDRTSSISFWKTPLVPRTGLTPQPWRMKIHPLRGRETHEASSFFLIQNKSNMWDYHYLIVFLQCSSKPRWEMPYVVI